MPADLARAERTVPSPENPTSENDPIPFADPIVKAICLKNWDANGDGEFSYAEAAAVTDIGKTFEGIGIQTFDELQYFTGLKSVSFSGCSKLTSIKIPDQVTTIESFQQCNMLTSLHIPDGVTRIRNSAFLQNYSLQSINIPDGVTVIASYTFFGCESLTDITIPEGVTSIETNAFRYCGLKHIYCKPAVPPTLGTETFDDRAATVYVPKTSVTDYMIYWSNYHFEIIGSDF